MVISGEERPSDHIEFLNTEVVSIKKKNLWKWGVLSHKEAVEHR